MCECNERGDEIGRGRLKTRHDDTRMFEIWRLVQEEIHVRGAGSVREACRRIVADRGARIWLPPPGDCCTDGKKGTKPDRIANEGTLRQRFQAAEAARHDAEQHPMLHRRCVALLEALPGAYERWQAMSAEGKRREAAGLEAATGKAKSPR